MVGFKWVVQFNSKVLRPNYVSKPTAESSLHSSTAAVRGGLTRR
jgi:hypothetical protein